MRFSTILVLLVVGYAVAASYPPWNKPAALKRPATPLEKAVKCPSGGSSCAASQTCCKLTSGGYGCCQYSNASCCSDGEHCCPKGYSCESKTGACVDTHASGAAESPAPMLQKLYTSPQINICPDQIHYCADTETCCYTGGGTYGCCPYYHAYCCSDWEHCCPAGKICLSSGTCF